MRLIYHPEAEAELVEAARFYVSRSPGLGERFLRKFDAAVKAVQSSPDRWSIVEADLRCHAMGGFPFGIYFAFTPMIFGSWWSSTTAATPIIGGIG